MASNLIKHSDPFLPPGTAKALSQVLRSRRLAEGPYVRKLERAFARAVGQPEAVATSSGSAALHLALRALGVGAGDRVVVPAYACSALALAPLYLGAKPTCADVDEDGLLESSEVKKVLRKRARAIILVHTYGKWADPRPLMELGVPVIEDVAHGFGGRVPSGRMGSSGMLTVTSFYATKFVGAGEGGAVAGPASLIAKIREWKTYDKKDAFDLRYNYKMSELHAAVAYCQIGCLPEVIRRRRRIADGYSQVLSGGTFALPRGGHHLFYRYVVRTTQARAAARRLAQGGIETVKPVHRPLHLDLGGSCPQAERLWREDVSLPIYPHLPAAAVRRVARVLA